MRKGEPSAVQSQEASSNKEANNDDAQDTSHKNKLKPVSAMSKTGGSKF
jgi:hypothetical protein